MPSDIRVVLETIAARLWEKHSQITAIGSGTALMTFFNED
jgi:hypothetical protein